MKGLRRTMSSAVACPAVHRFCLLPFDDVDDVDVTALPQSVGLIACWVDHCLLVSGMIFSLEVISGLTTVCFIVVDRPTA